MTRGAAVTPPPTTLGTPNPMPALPPKVRAALKDSINEFGVMEPIVVDQTGFILNGRNRFEIANELGITCKVTVEQCPEEKRFIRTIELNSTGRQLPSGWWKDAVDSLRQKVDAKGVYLYSDREIAQAVGVSPATLSRYKPSVSSATPAPKTVRTKSGRTQHISPQGTATDRVLELIRKSTTGLTAVDLRKDPQLQAFGSSTVGKIPTQLHERGLIEPTAPIKRGVTTVWRAVTTPPPTSPPLTKTTVKKANRIVDDLQVPEVRDAVQERLALDKGVRQAQAAVRAAEKEVEAARLDKEKWTAEQEKERVKLLDAARAQLGTSIKTWEKLTYEVDLAWKMIASYSVITKDLPAISPATERILDRSLAELRQQLEWLENRRYPKGRPHGNPLAEGVIDV